MFSFAIAIDPRGVSRKHHAASCYLVVSYRRLEPPWGNRHALLCGKLNNFRMRRFQSSLVNFLYKPLSWHNGGELDLNLSAQCGFLLCCQNDTNGPNKCELEDSWPATVAGQLINNTGAPGHFQLDSWRDTVLYCSHSKAPKEKKIPVNRVIVFCLLECMWWSESVWSLPRVSNHSNSLPFSSSRPGRPPKRAPVGLSLAASHLQHQQMKKHRMDNGDYPYENGHMGAGKQSNF